jgi:hypothetical protein
MTKCTCCPLGFESQLPGGPSCPKHDTLALRPWTPEDSINYAKRWPGYPIPPWKRDE